jgi:hypothetical protein
MASAATSNRRVRRADTAGLEVALLERALTEGGLLFTRASPGLQCFYRLTLQPTLFGGWDLLREWGRLAPTQIATRRLVEHYRGLSEALLPLGDAVRLRLRRGYRARPLPARFIPSAAIVYWCPAPPAAIRLASATTRSKSGSGSSCVRTQVQRITPAGSTMKTDRLGMPL